MLYTHTQCTIYTLCTPRFTATGAVKGNVTKPDWAHVFLTVTDPLALPSAQQEEQTAAALRAACAELMAKHGGRLRKAAVAQWEVRLAAAAGAPAWRVVVASPTGQPMLVAVL